VGGGGSLRGDSFLAKTTGEKKEKKEGIICRARNTYIRTKSINLMCKRRVSLGGRERFCVDRIRDALKKGRPVGKETTDDSDRYQKKGLFPCDKRKKL